MTKLVFFYLSRRDHVNMPYPIHNYQTRNNNDKLLPHLRVEAIRKNFRYQFVKVWLGVTEYTKCQWTCASFRNALTDYYFSRYWRLFFSLILVQSTLYLFTIWALSLVNLFATIKSVLLFILYLEFTSGFYVWQLGSLFCLLWQ